MINADEARSLVGVRVAWATAEGEQHSLLRGVTPAGMAIFADDHSGQEQWVPVGDLNKIVEARHVCAGCGAQVNRVHQAGDDLCCAMCTRVWAAKQPRPLETCEGCGKLGAYYSPRAKRFACAQCHAEAGTNVGLHVEIRAREALARESCKGEDVHSLRHVWAQVRGKWICTGCGTKTYDQPAGWRVQDR